jgi:hypothetical protein
MVIRFNTILSLNTNDDNLNDKRTTLLVLYLFTIRVVFILDIFTNY